MNILWTVLLGLANALVVGVLVRRIISVGAGALRNTIVSVIVGLSLWPITLQAYRMVGITDVGEFPGLEMSFPAIMVFLLIFAWFIVIQMSVLLALELVLPSGSLSGLFRRASKVPTIYRRVSRLTQIQKILVQYGLGRYLKPRLPTWRISVQEIARTTAEAFAAAGVTFVKFGQFIATRADIVPAEFVEEFSKLQSDVPPVPFSELEPGLEKQWGRGVDEVFATFDREPMAAASVAQVHKATLLDGTEVVVKVQRPKLRKQVRADSDIVRTLARQVESRAGWAQNIGLTGLAENFLDSLAEELDYRIEVANTLDLRAASGLEPDATVRIPKVYPELSSATVIVMERIEGVPVSKGGEVLEGLSDIARADIADDLFVMVAHQVLQRGIFHADLHAGNVIVDASGRAGLIDFGAVGRLDKRDRTALALLLLAFKNQDSMAATNAVLSIFGNPPGLDLRQVQREIGQIMLQFSTASPFGYSAVFGQLLTFIMDTGFTMPPAVASAFRAISALEGTLKKLDPDLDLLQMVDKHGRELLHARADVSATWESAQLYTAFAGPAIAELPFQLNRVLGHLEDGTFDIATSGFDLSGIKPLVRSVIDQLTLVIIATALILGGIIMMVADFGPNLAPELKLFTYFGGWILLPGLVLAEFILAPILKNRSLVLDL